MPSDVRDESANDAPSPIEPPSAKLLVRLFLIPFVIVGLAVGIVFLISLMAGREPSVDEAIAGLKNSGGGRTADLLVGPGSKQRYLYAKTLTDKMKSGLSPADRVKVSDEIIDILRNHTRADEGEVQHFLLLALGRAWQIDPRHSESESPEFASSREKATQTLIEFAASNDLSMRKASLLAMVYFKGRADSVAQFIPVLVKTLENEQEDLDARLAAATALGPLADSKNADVLEALHRAARDTDPKDVELVWQSALSLAELGQTDISDTILKLLNRDELAKITVYDRETDPNNPIYRKLSEAEQQRILINTMIGVEHLNDAAVQAQLKKIGETDPSPRVRAALQANAPLDAASE